MATTHRTAVRTDVDRPDVRSVLLTTAYAASILGTLAVTTGAAIWLASQTSGLGGFVLVAGGWLAVVSASPALGKRIVARLAEIDVGQHAPRSSRVVNAAVTYVLAR